MNSLFLTVASSLCAFEILPVLDRDGKAFDPFGEAETNGIMTYVIKLTILTTTHIPRLSGIMRISHALSFLGLQR